jgi:prepilin-type N-terminal cleavage/methylation domain-containing protein
MKTKNVKTKNGFTLVELLVVIAIIGLLVALLLPALNVVREAARRSQCSTNLKQFSLAVLTYESAKRELPSSHSGEGWSAQAAVTPFLEQGHIYTAINFSVSYKDPSSLLNGTPISALRVPGYTCPSEPNTQIRVSGSESHAPISYVVNMGPWFVWDPVTKTGGDGVFYPEDGVQLRQIGDGTSRTMMASEVKTYNPYYRNLGDMDTNKPMPTLPSEICALGSSGGDFKTNSGHTEWVDGRVHQTGFTTTFQPNTEVDCSGFDVDFNNWQEGKPGDAFTYGAVTARSHHPGIVNVVMMDNSVHSISNEIELQTWQAMSTKNGGDAQNDFLP